MFRHVGDGAAELAAGPPILQQSQKDQDDGRPPADLSEGRQEADDRRRQPHDQHRDEERALAADDIPETTEDEGAERPEHEPGSESGQRSEEGRGLVAGRKEEDPEEGREASVDEEVVPFEHGAEGGGEHDAAGVGRIMDPGRRLIERGALALMGVVALVDIGIPSF